MQLHHHHFATSLRAVLAACVSLITITVPFAQAQLSRLYVTNNQNVAGACIDVYRNQAFDFSFNTAGAQNYFEAPIAIWGDVRTQAYPPNSGGFGHRYDLNGNYLGQAYPIAGTYRYDGTTDGQYNYAVDGGTVTRYDRQWQNPTPLFASPTARTFGDGITYDPFDQTLWLHTFVQDQISGVRTFWVEQFTPSGTRLGGAPISSSSPFYFADFSGLALDPADRTLWIVNQVNFLQVDRNGVGLIDPIQPYPFVYVNPTGAEFDLFVPEPAAAVLLLPGIASLLMQKRRRA